MAARAKTTAVHQVGAIGVSLASNDPVAFDRLHALYAGFDVVEEGGDDMVRVRVDRDETDGRWISSINDATVRQSEHLAVIEDAVTRRINRLVLDAEDDRLHLHAGAVHRDGATVLIVGTSGSGKSTLVAQMVAAGWQYLSDEQMGVLPGGRLVPYPRPITLRRNSWPLLKIAVAPTLPASVERLEVAPHDLGAVYAGEAVAPTLILCPDVTKPQGSVALSASEVVATMLVDTMDLERAGGPGFDALVALATTAPGLSVTGTDSDTTMAQVEAWIQSSPSAPTCVEKVGPMLNVTAASAWLFSDDTAVIYDPEVGKLLSLDRAGYEAWKLVLTPRHGWPDELANSSFVADIVEAGVLNVNGMQP